MMLPVDQNTGDDYCETEEVAAVGFVTAGTAVLSEDPNSRPESYR